MSNITANTRQSRYTGSGATNATPLFASRGGKKVYVVQIIYIFCPLSVFFPADIAERKSERTER